MLLIVVRIVFLLVCAGVMASVVAPSSSLPKPIFFGDYPFTTFAIGMAVAAAVVGLDAYFRPKRIETISAIYFGLIVGFGLNALLLQAIRPAIDDTYEPLLTLLSGVVVIYFCISVLLQTRDDFRFVIPYVEFSRRLKGGTPLIVDTSALIDGRIVKLFESNLLDARVIIPAFVLTRIRSLADSPDKQDRARGRRALEVAAALRDDKEIETVVLPGSRPDAETGSDERVVELAIERDARLVTTDPELLRVATLEGVPSVNLNEVAAALKPRFFAGDHVTVTIKELGTGPGQGVGYLKDGTKVICERAAERIGDEIEIVVTSVLQSSGGRMLFGQDRQLSQ
ncbi:MAG: TRAM domain-containing protein [Planctomycetota bacterium]